MSTREDYPAGVPCWVDTNQPDPADAARFYSGLFGWQTEDSMPPDAGGHYYMARIDGRDAAAISSPPPGTPPQAVWNTYIRVESADDAAARVREAGGQVLSEPFDVFDAGRMCMFADPEGAVFCVWQPGSHRGSAAVNEHGAVNFNNLHTDDVDAARAFYGTVFGWTTIEADSPMWALPGYGDHLEELNPGLRAGMKQMGAPERDLRRRRRGRDSCASARTPRLGPRRAAECAMGAIRRHRRPGRRILHRQPVRGGEPLDDRLAACTNVPMSGPTGARVPLSDVGVTVVK